MPQESLFKCDACGRTNRNGERAYGEFHRAFSLSRFISYEDAARLHNINLDTVLWMECDENTNLPIALIETAEDTGQDWKAVTATLNLAVYARLRAYLVLYTLGKQIDPYTGELEIASLRARMIWPRPRPFATLTPDQYAKWLVKLHDHCKSHGALCNDDEIRRIQSASA